MATFVDVLFFLLKRRYLVHFSNFCKRISQGAESIKLKDREMPDYKKYMHFTVPPFLVCVCVWDIKHNISNICNSVLWVVERLFFYVGHLVHILLAAF